MAEKKTKRLAFNFMRSYFDVLNEIDKDADKLSFLMAIINKQFLHENPEDMNFLVNLCYQSQKHAVEKSVKGWVIANKTDLQGNPTPPKGSGTTPDPKGDPTPDPTPSPMSDPKEVQEQEQEEEQEEEKYIYNDQSFLKNWANARTKYLGKPTHIKKLDFNESINFKEIVKDYTEEEIITGIHGLFKQKNRNISSMYLKPKHFLENFVKYYNAELCKDFELYGKGEKPKTEL